MNEILALDLGHSRLKWGLLGAHGWIGVGALANQDIGTLTLREWQNLPRPARAVGVNVAGEAARVRVEAQLVRWRVTPEWLIAKAEARGVKNLYSLPSQLSPDRWAALVAAHDRMVAELFPMACVVVNAGTIVSIDALDGEGAFRGGLVLPGLNLMLQSLSDKAPALNVGLGHYHDFPINAADAITSGVMSATCGAIGEMRARLGQSSMAPLKCFLTGGAAHDIAPHLTAPVEVVDNLVLDGIVALAQTTA